MDMKLVIISGYFSLLHGGYLDMINAAVKPNERLLTAVNNNKDQVLNQAVSIEK